MHGDFSFWARSHSAKTCKNMCQNQDILSRPLDDVTT